MKNMVPLLVVPFLFSCGDGGGGSSDVGISKDLGAAAEIAELKERITKLENRDSRETLSSHQHSQPETKPSGAPFPKLSPFTEVSCYEDRIIVAFSGKRYELVSIDGLSTKQIIGFCRKTFSVRWKKRFAEDLIEVMSGMGKEVGSSVNLALKELDTNNVITVPDAPMTADNRRAVWESRQ